MSLLKNNTTDDKVDWIEAVGWCNYNILCATYNTKVKCQRTGTFDRWDIEQTGGKPNTIVEIKVRLAYGINDFNDLRVDKKKIDSLREETKRTGKTPFLVCFYPKDDKVVIWNLLREYNLTSLKANVRTVVSRNVKAIKEMYQLPIADGVTLTHKFVNIEPKTLDL